MMLYAEFLIVFVLYLAIDTRVVYYYGTTKIWFGLDFLLCMCSYLIMVFVRQKKISWCLMVVSSLAICY